MKELLGRALKHKHMTHNELSMLLEYIQLQMKALDKKNSISDREYAGLTFNEPSEETLQVSGENVPFPHV